MAYRLEKPTLFDETGAASAQRLAVRLQQVEGGPAGYRLRRIILTNFWLYEHQVFEIPHGRLFLAGDNGSGKSTVLTAAITLALDGDHRPERIDTFGKREKKIDYYILGGESNTPFHRDQRTSYIGLEFEWCEMEDPPFASELRALWEQGTMEKARFLTIGVGFAGNKNNVKPITDTYFLITDGTRLEKDLSTLVSVPGEQNQRACDLKTFKKMVGEHGLIYERQTDYAQKVAQYLFNFPKTEDLTRLTRQLLYLRQPNLNSVLSLEKVRSYLDESLPELPMTLIERAAVMLDKMEELQDTTAKRKSAYNAAEKLHRAQQIVAMARARLCACESLHTFALLESKRKEVQRMERSINKSERDLETFQARVKALETEEQELQGYISALEKSEGMQLAQSLSDTRTKVQEAEEALAQSQSTLQTATDRREQTEAERENLSQIFQKRQRETLQLLQHMQSSSNTEAHWPIASEQLQAAVKRVSALTLDASQLDIPEALSSLGEYAIAEQLAWLGRLKRLHAELEQVTSSLQAAHQQELQTYKKVDKYTRAFESKRTDVCTAQQDLADQLELLLEETQWAALIPSSEQAALSWNAPLLPAESVPALAKVQQIYVEAIERIQEGIHREQEGLERRLQSAHGDQGAKLKERERLQEAYQQKLLEPEFVPERTPHRQKARAYLAREGIQAFPFYMLVDFAEELDSQSPLAGGIEQALADAGLLDALVVLPEAIAAMDACCAVHGLNDCRLDWQHLTGKQGVNQFLPTLTRLLRVDPALSESVKEKASAWSETASLLLDGLQATSSPSEEHLNYWAHGLLAGTIGTGEARCIGKATRVHAQQQELARLREQEALLAQELERLAATIEQFGQEKQALTDLDRELVTLLSRNNIAELGATLQAALENLDQAQAEYSRAQKAAQDLGRQLQALRSRLEKEAGQTLIFATDQEKVEKARETIQSLKSDHKTLMIYFTNVRETWRGYQRVQRQLIQDNSEERKATLSQQRDEHALTRVRAELTTLEQMARETGGVPLASLQEQLTNWKLRQSKLPQDLQAARDNVTRTGTILEGHRGSYTNLSTEQNQLEKQYENNLQTFRALLSSYPVEMLLDIQRQIAESAMHPKCLQLVLRQALEAGIEAYNALKAELEKSLTKTHSDLLNAFTEVNSLLHEYGPHFDEADIVRFTNADETNAYGLLTRLSEEIRLQEQLLEAKEYELFQNFLLKEMANTVGTCLTDAEAWVDRMNAILADSPFMEKCYRLKWAIRPHDPQRPGSYLALYRDVLRRQAETFNQEEIEKLVDAFKQEIKSQRAQQTTETATFTEALINILDYRRWFQFEIDMLHPDGSTVQRLTNKFLRTGSGAEQYIALYIPFFTALSALYERAGNGAPRLIALDEAFDKVSIINKRKLLNFLARQNFQWIMTGPRVTGEGTELSACVKYTMFCRKSEELAAGFPAFWSNNPAIAKEVQSGQ
jgi:DNA repair exonuclease SbcCD ATPase subunit